MSFLGSLLREGTQAGMGYLQGRDVRRASDAQAQAAAKREEEDKQKRALEMAFLQARLGHTEAQTRKLSEPPEFKMPNQFELEGMMLEQMNVNPQAPDQDILDSFLDRNREIPGSMAQVGLQRIRRTQESDRRAEDAAGRADASQARSESSAARREQVATLTAHAFDAKQRGLDYNATLTELRTRFPSASEEIVLQAATRAHNAAGSGAMDLIELFRSLGGGE